MAAIAIESPPAAEPISLALMKSHLRVTLTADDDLIGLYIQAARELFESTTARSLVNKGFRQSLDAFPYFTDSMYSQASIPPAYSALPRYSTAMWNYSQLIKLVFSPLVKVTSIDYIDSQTSELTSLYPDPEPWRASTEYVIGDQILDTNGNLQEVTTVTEGDFDDTSESGATRPAWESTLNASTADNDLTWTLVELDPELGDFIYDKDSEPPRIFPNAAQNWPSCLYVPNAVVIHYVAGYGNDGNGAPATARVAIMQTVANWYENREPVTSPELKKIPHHLEALYWENRVIDLAPTRG
jgi:hypothetical protein